MLRGLDPHLIQIKPVGHGDADDHKLQDHVLAVAQIQDDAAALDHAPEADKAPDEQRGVDDHHHGLEGQRAQHVAMKEAQRAARGASAKAGDAKGGLHAAASKRGHAVLEHPAAQGQSKEREHKEGA